MSGESGSVGVLVAAIAAVTIFVSLLVLDVAHIYAARAGLVTAADAAALAAAPVTFSPFGSGGSPIDVAAESAARNGAEIVGCSCDIDRSWSPRQVRVTAGVLVDLAVLGDRQLTATSAAEFRPTALGVAGH